MNPRSRTSTLLPILAAAVALFAAPALAQACDVEPETDAARRACIERSCGHLEGWERARCVAQVYDTWRIVSGCSSVAAGPLRDACIRDALRDNAIEEAVARVEHQQLILGLISQALCLRDGDPETCFGGRPRLRPLPPPDPFLVSVLREIGPNERGALYQSVASELEVQRERRKEFVAKAFAAADSPRSQSE